MPKFNERNFELVVGAMSHEYGQTISQLQIKCNLPTGSVLHVIRKLRELQLSTYVIRSRCYYNRLTEPVTYHQVRRMLESRRSKPWAFTKRPLVSATPTVKCGGIEVNPTKSGGNTDKRHDCTMYRACVNLAIRKNWDGFTCAECPLGDIDVKQ